MQPLYDSIGSNYCATRCADLGITRELARLVGVKDGSRFLDLACGAGNYTCALASVGGRWHGIDISETMLKQAAAKNPEIEWKIGGAEALPARGAVIAALESAGFEVDEIIPFHVTDQLQDLFLYAGKERPELYFDPVVRANISSFASLCTAEELKDGLRALRADLDSGHFQRVAQGCSSSAGDYAFVVARRHGVLKGISLMQSEEGMSDERLPA